MSKISRTATEIHRKQNLLDDDPHTVSYESQIINTLLKMKRNGLSDLTIKDISNKLKRLSKIADLNNPEEVKMAIANLDIVNSTRNSYAKAYNYFTKENGIEWNRPRYKYERKVPIIPSTANIDKIISASTRKYATIFTILKETGFEGHELARAREGESRARTCHKK